MPAAGQRLRQRVGGSWPPKAGCGWVRLLVQPQARRPRGRHSPALAYALRKIDLGTTVAARFPTINAFLANKWYLDAINDKLFVQGSRKLARSVLEVDSKVVDGVVNLTGLVTLGSGEGLKYFETGRAQFYALIVFGGVIALVVLFGALG